MKLLGILVVLLLSACTSVQYPACSWHEVSARELADRCNDWDKKLMGCQTGSTTCDLWVRKP